MRAPRVHHAARRRGGGVAARGARAAGRAGAAHRRAPARSRGRSGNQARVAAFLQGLALLGWTIGRNVRIDTRWAADQCRPTFADTRRNWSRSRRTSSWPSAPRPWRPLLQATRTVPIVFAVVTDPVGAGFVDSLARPGGNATGFMKFEYSMSGKWLELLKEIAPGVTRAAVLRDPAISLWDRPVRRHPGRGAVARGGGEPGRRARRRRDRARRRGIRARRRMAA